MKCANYIDISASFLTLKFNNKDWFKSFLIPNNPLVSRHMSWQVNWMSDGLGHYKKKPQSIIEELKQKEPLSSLYSFLLREVLCYPYPV